jgi:bifunctional DNA-binding transcriptional regulator/antitoxin component of YhaV-PrlF toxin-antitoxin module
MPARTPDRGYSGTPLPRKLGIKEGSELLITAEGDGQRLRGPYDVIVLFAQTRAEVERRFRELAAKLEPNGRLWIGWPKRASGIPIDITENVLREIILPSGLVDNKVAAIDERWSGLQFVWRLKNRPAASASG